MAQLSTLGIVSAMNMKPLMIAVSLAFLAACAPNHAKPPAIATSGTNTVSGAQVFPAETQARLDKLEDEYGFTIKDHQITVSGGIVTQERVNQITNALQEVLGSDYATNYTMRVLKL